MAMNGQDNEQRVTFSYLWDMICFFLCVKNIFAVAAFVNYNVKIN